MYKLNIFPRNRKLQGIIIPRYFLHWAKPKMGPAKLYDVIWDWWPKISGKYLLMVFPCGGRKIYFLLWNYQNSAFINQNQLVQNISTFIFAIWNLHSRERIWRRFFHFGNDRFVHLVEKVEIMVTLVKCNQFFDRKAIFTWNYGTFTVYLFWFLKSNTLRYVNEVARPQKIITRPIFSDVSL